MVICKFNSKCDLALPLRGAIGNKLTSLTEGDHVNIGPLSWSQGNLLFSDPTELACIHVNGTTGVSGDVCVSGDLELGIFLAPKHFYTAVSEWASVMTP